MSRKYFKKIKWQNRRVVMKNKCMNKSRSLSIDRKVRSIRDLKNVLQEGWDKKAGEVVVNRSRSWVRRELAGEGFYARIKGFDLFFEGDKDSKVLKITARRAGRDPVFRLADLVTFGTFGAVA